MATVLSFTANIVVDTVRQITYYQFVVIAVLPQGSHVFAIIDLRHAMASMLSRHHFPRVVWSLFVILWLFAVGFAVPAFASPDARQSTLFVNNCAQCHARQETGAPFIGVEKDWQDALGRGEDAMLINVVQGIRGMPPLGYCSACTEEDFRVLIRMLAGIPGAPGEQQ